VGRDEPAEAYRAMFRGGFDSWNLRDRRMAESLEDLSAHLLRTSGRGKVAVWEHNSHIGEDPAPELFHERASSEPAKPPMEGRHVHTITGGAMASCTHLNHVLITDLPESVEGCEDCLLTGDPWLHLRICLECGHVGCCDDSPNRHARAHSASSDHPIIRSLEPGERWSWCFLDEVAMVIPDVQGETRIPPSPLGG
jgi:hypothetical protein